MPSANCLQKVAAFLNNDTIQTGTWEKFHVYCLIKSSKITTVVTLLLSNAILRRVMKWTDESVKPSIALYHEHESKLEDVNLKNNNVWEAIAKGMRDKNSHSANVQYGNERQQEGHGSQY